jgi:hypothetical protein
MKKILFYYSMVICATLLIVSLFFVSGIANIILAASLIPVAAFFWINFTNPGETDFPHWSLRFLVVIVAFIALGIFAYSLSLKSAKTVNDPENKLTDSATQELKNAIEELGKNDKNTSNQALLSALESIQHELVNIRAEQRGINQILGITTSASDAASLIQNLNDKPVNTTYLNGSDEMGFIKLSENVTVSVYSEQSNSAKKLGVVTYGPSYPFFKKQNGWYQILLPDDTKGWVKSSYIEETF